MKSHRKNFKAKKEFEESVIQIDRVTRVVKGGRRLRFRATVCVGDKKGRVGVGIGKSNEVTGAIQKAVNAAKKTMIKVPLFKGSIPHDHQVKFKSAIVLFKPAQPGTGIIAGGAVRTVLELAGVKNILTKSLGTTNKLSTSKATILALSELRKTPAMEKAEKAKQEIKQKAPFNKGQARKATPRKTEAAKKAPVKKTEAAKKAPAKKAPAKKAPAKKAE